MALSHRQSEAQEWIETFRDEGGFGIIDVTGPGLQERGDENTGTPIVHVRDGKPLTAHGAKLLGVEWSL